MRHDYLWVVLALAIGLSSRAEGQTRTGERACRIPEWVETAMVRSGLDKTLAFDGRLNPSCYRGDFDGDGAIDAAVLVQERASGRKGIAFIHRRDGRVFVVGAGTTLSNGGDDWSWMDAWTVSDKGDVGQGATEERPPLLRGDVLLVYKTDAASAIVWWDGERYRWYQQGD